MPTNGAGTLIGEEQDKGEVGVVEAAGSRLVRQKLDAAELAWRPAWSGVSWLRTGPQKRLHFGSAERINTPPWRRTSSANSSATVMIAVEPLRPVRRLERQTRVSAPATVCLVTSGGLSSSENPMVGLRKCGLSMVLAIIDDYSAADRRIAVRLAAPAGMWV